MGAFLDLWDVSDGHPKARAELEHLAKTEEALRRLTERVESMFSDQCWASEDRWSEAIEARSLLDA